MYSDRRIAKWTARSSSKEYQRAYDTIARHIPYEAGFCYVEAACGTGELLKRIRKRGDHGALIGIDSSRAMLDLARDGLSKLGLDVPIIGGAAMRTPQDSALVLDDLLDSKMPCGFADITVFTFPELGSDCFPSPIDRDLVDRFVSRFGLFDPQVYGDLLVTLRAQYHLARITKPGGLMVIAEYDVSRGKDSRYDQEIVSSARLIWDSLDVKLERSLFFESPKIWSDTRAAAEDDETLKYAKKGYKILMMRKDAKRRRSKA